MQLSSFFSRLDWDVQLKEVNHFSSLNIGRERERNNFKQKQIYFCIYWLKMLKKYLNNNKEELLEYIIYSIIHEELFIFFENE